MSRPRSIFFAAVTSLLAAVILMLPASLAVHTAAAHVDTSGVVAACGGHIGDCSSEQDRDGEEENCDLCDLLSVKTTQIAVEADTDFAFFASVDGAAISEGERLLRGPPISEKQSRAPPARA